MTANDISTTGVISKGMERKRFQRTEGNGAYSCLTCAPLLLTAFILSRVAEFWLPGSGMTVFGVLLFPFACFDLWWVGRLMTGRWYFEYDNEGLTYRIFTKRYRYPWRDVRRVYSKKSPEFIGKYHDHLVIETRTKSANLFLHDFGLHSKRPTVALIEDVIATWEHANPEAASEQGPPREPPSESDEEDIYDDERVIEESDD